MQASTVTERADRAGRRRRRFALGITAAVLLAAGGGCDRAAATSNRASPSASSSAASSSSAAAASSSAAPPASRAASACPPGMAYVPAGTFAMGAASAWPLTGEHADDAVANEMPQHRVSVQAFCIDVVEVTAGDFERCAASGRCARIGAKDPRCGFDARFERHPMTCVTEAEAAAICATRGARLPTEIEWEYAARGGDGRVYPWGNAPTPREHTSPDRVCRQIALPARATCPVGAYPVGKSPFGVLDLVGNAQEWTSSPFCDYPEHACSDAAGAVVVRGSSGATDFDRVTARRRAMPSEWSLTRGFRCALSK